jgi:hypothetical protein
MNSDSNKTDKGKATNTGMNAPDAKTSTPAKAAEHPVSQPGVSQPEVEEPASAGHHSLLAAIRTRWGNLAETDVKDVKTREDLSAAVKAKYGITADQATTQVNEWAIGRQF